MKYVRFYGSSGTPGSEYEEFEAYDEDELYDGALDDESAERGFANAEFSAYNTVWESEEEKDDYFDTALSYCGWEFITEEEYNEMVE